MNTKICSGPAHGGEAVPLPLTEEHWYFRHSGTRAGEARYPCRLCRSLQGQKGGWIDCRRVLKYVQELEHRCGSLEQVAEITRVSSSTLYRIQRGGQCSLARETAAKIIRALDEKRREDRRNGYVHPRFIQARQYQARVERSLAND